MSKRFALFGYFLLRVLSALAMSNSKYTVVSPPLRNISEVESGVVGVPSRSLIECAISCSLNPSCQSAVWSHTTRSCGMAPSLLTARLRRQSADDIYTAKIPEGNCSYAYYSGCANARAMGVSQSGVVYVDPDGGGCFPVWCDFESERSWLVMQRRLDGSVDFYRGWSEYKSGFGSATGELWLGLSSIRRLTASGTQLSIYLESFDGARAYANYSYFTVGPESADYVLSVNGYSGTAGDSLTAPGSPSYNHSGMPFSTKDHGSKCAQSYVGAWWYHSCFASNLNGVYYGNGSTTYGGACWYAFKGFTTSLKTIVMRILA